jgi:hypothetical protein
MRRFLPMLLLLIAPAAFASHATPYGEAMPESEPVSIAVAAADPAAYAGKPMRFSGRITQVCQKKGCWVVLEADGHSARVMAKDHGFAVPTDSAGVAHAWGVLQVEPISAEHARHLVEDDGATAPAAQELRIVATGIEILDDVP